MISNKDIKFLIIIGNRYLDNNLKLNNNIFYLNISFCENI